MPACARLRESRRSTGRKIMIAARRHFSWWRMMLGGACSAVLLVAAALVRADGPRAPTVDRIRASGKIVLGYRGDARPFSYKTDTGRPAGYSVDLCERIAEGVRHDLKLTNLQVDWTPVDVADRFRAVQEGRIDVLCAADTITLARRLAVSFSIPIFQGGIGALVRGDSPVRLREVLAGHDEIVHPIWRADASQILQARAFTAVNGTTADGWLADHMDTLHVLAPRASVDSYDEGIQALSSHQADVFFGDRAILLDAVHAHKASRNLILIDRLFTYEPVALALRRDDEDFRLVVDRALSHVYRFGGIGALYAQTFGEPDQSAVNFYRWNALAE
jgi:polar amino acid transport system substrate-binding protein